MSTDAFVAALHKLRFFEGYPADAAKRAEAQIRKQHQEGTQGPQAAYFEQFPGFALVFLVIYGEWDYEPYEPLVESVAEGSFGMFKPTTITDERDPDDPNRATLSFTVDGVGYSAESEVCGGWVPSEFLELIEEAFAKHCGNLHFHETYLCAIPGGGDQTTMTICTARAYKELVKSKLLPEDPSEIESV